MAYTALKFKTQVSIMRIKSRQFKLLKRVFEGSFYINVNTNTILKIRIQGAII